MRLRRNDRVTPLKDQAGCNCHSLKSWWSYRHLLPPTSEVCEGYVFTSVCLSTGRVSASGPGGVSSTHTPEQTLPPGRHHHPLGRHPTAQCILGYTPPAQWMLGYGQQAGGTHPTGMHSCSSLQTSRRYDLSGAFKLLWNLSCCTYWEAYGVPLNPSIR